MKYLNINQSLLNNDGKFEFNYYLFNDHKYNFTKLKNNTECSIFKRMFRKYLNNDIKIIWSQYEIFKNPSFYTK